MRNSINRILLCVAFFATVVAALAQSTRVITDGKGNFLALDIENEKVKNTDEFNPATCVWTYSGTSSGTVSITVGSTTYYLYRSSYSLSLTNSTRSASTWYLSSGNQLYTTSRSYSYYITCSSGSWALSTSSTTNAASAFTVSTVNEKESSNVTVSYNNNEQRFERVGDARDYYVESVSYTPAYNKYSWNNDAVVYYASADNSYVTTDAPTTITEADSYEWTSSHPNNVTVTASTEYPEEATAEYLTKFSQQTIFTVTATATISKSKSKFMTADAKISGTSMATLLSRDVAELLISVDKRTLYVGETAQLSVQTESDGTVQYSSGNTDVAEISSTGLLTAKGTDGVDERDVVVTISVPQTESYEAGTSLITFTVKKRPVTATLTYDKSTLTYGEEKPNLLTCTLVDGVTGSELAAPDVQYSSSSTCLSVNPTTGAITINQAGSAVVTAYYQGDDTYCSAKASYVITVNKAPTTLTFDHSSYLLQLGHENEFTSPVAKLTPDGVGNVTYSYTSETAGLITLDPLTGAVTAGTLTGTATVTATFAGNDCYEPSSASYELIVSSKNYPTLTVTTEVEFYVDATYKVQATTNSANGVTFASNDESIVTIATDGTLTAVGEGTTTLCVTSVEDDDYMEYHADYPVTVKRYPTIVTIAYPQTLYYTDYEGNIVPEVTLHNAVDNKLVDNEGLFSFSATPSTVVTVDDLTGHVSMTGGGYGSIMVTYAGNRKYAPSTATVVLEIRKVASPGTFIRLRDAAGKCLSADGTSVTTADTEDASTIIWYGEDHSLLFYQCGLYLKNAECQLADVVNVGESGTKFTFTHNGDEYKISDGSQFLTSEGSDQWTMEEVEFLPLTFKSVGLGYSTFYCPVDVTCPAGVVAYYATERKADITGASDYVITLQSMTGGYIPHNTPVVLQTNYIDTYDFYIVGEIMHITLNTWDGLVGTLPKVTTASAYSGTQYPYTLQPNTYHSVGFYPWQSANHAAIEPFRCYIPGSTAGNANSFRFVIGDDTVSGIDALIAAPTESDTPIYNMQGIPVGSDLRSLPTGVYIQNGKKVWKR